MTKIRTVQVTFVTTAIVTAIFLLWCKCASAGTLVVHDSAEWLSSADVQILRSESGKWPFDVHLLVERAPSFQKLEQDAHAAVTSPNVMVIAIDPGLHKTVTRFGTATGVKTGDYDSITAAGTADFRAKENRHGIEMMVTRATASRQATTAMSVSNTPVVLKQGMSGGEWFMVILISALIVGVLIWLVRRMMRTIDSNSDALTQNKLETSELLSRNVERMTTSDELYTQPAPVHTSGRALSSSDIDRQIERDIHTMPNPDYRRVSGVPRAVVINDAPTYVRPPPQAPVYIQPAPVPVYQPPVYVQQNSGIGDFTTGLLVGEALARPRERDVYIERDVIREDVIREEPVYRRTVTEEDNSYTRQNDAGGGAAAWAPQDDPSPASPDNGGSSTSWDSGSTSSYDSPAPDPTPSNDTGGGGSDSW